MANLESMEISHRVYRLAKECQVSGNEAINLMEFHGLVSEYGRGPWDSYKDKRVLDVCSGLSNFTAKLLQLGADAHALDYGYQDVGELLKRSGNRPAGQFLESYVGNRDRYIYGSSHNLPFASESFDAVTSYYGIFGTIDDDVDLAYQSISEGIRVLKPGGIISLGPLKSGSITKKQAESEDEILARLDKINNIILYVKNSNQKSVFGPPLDISRLGRLTIVKSF